MLGLRTPVDDLRAKYPQLADKIQYIARQMEASTSNEVSNANPKSPQLAIDWENTVGEIRGLPGFEGFLKAKTFYQLAPVAYEGPVVILNVENPRSDALVLISHDSEEKQVSVVNIPFTRFSYETGQKLCEKLVNLLKSSGLLVWGETCKTGRVLHGEGVESTFQKILRILWLDVVQPVIEALAYQVCHCNDRSSLLILVSFRPNQNTLPASGGAQQVPLPFYLSMLRVYTAPKSAINYRIM